MQHFLMYFYDWAKKGPYRATLQWSWRHSQIIRRLYIDYFLFFSQGDMRSGGRIKYFTEVDTKSPEHALVSPSPN